jgi:hypothetical protein
MLKKDNRISNNAPTLQDLERFRFNPSKEIKKPESILSLNGVSLCTPGNISNIQGQAKSAKSSVMGAAVAAILRALTDKKPDEFLETLGFTSELAANTPKNQKVILHFDTEQSSYHHHKLAMDILKRADIDKKEASNIPFYSYSLVCIDLMHRQSLIEKKIEELEEKGNRLACLMLDGVADLVSDPNNADESFAVVAWLHGLAESKKCAVITILHENPGDAGKARGHLGSQIQRKSETNLRVAKAGDKPDAISYITIERARGANLPGDHKIPISWCKKSERHLLHDRKKSEAKTNAAPSESNSDSKLTKSDRELKAWLEQKLKTPVSHKVLKDLVKEKIRCAPRTAITKINDWTKRGWIHKLNPDNKQSPYTAGSASKNS